MHVCVHVFVNMCVRCVGTGVCACAFVEYVRVCEYLYAHVFAVYMYVCIWGRYMCMRMSMNVAAFICAIKFADLIMVQQSGNRSAKSVLWGGACGFAQKNAMQ